MSENNQNKEDWINTKWRPAMGWMYLTVCIFDFIIFPILWAVIQFWETNAVNDAFRQWSPLTLIGSGLFHMAMGAVLGITAFGRTKEKIEGAAGGFPVAPTPAPQPAPVSSFAPSPVVTQAPTAQPMPTASFAPVAQPMAAPANQFTASGKKIVPQDPDPEI